jgi:multiple sugar transport system permease protein
MTIQAERQDALHPDPEPPATERHRERAKSKSSTNGLARSQNRWGWIFAAPAIIGFFLFVAGPMVASFIIGLTNWQIGLSPAFVGFDNYVHLVQDPSFWDALKATAYYVIVAVPGGVLVAFLAALLLNRVRRGRGLFRVVFYLPVLVPPVASAVIWLWIFAPDAGLANSFLKMLGLPPLQWIYDQATAVPSVALVTIWAFGNMALIFLAALQGVPRELLEAAEMDGAGPFRRMLNVTIPQVSPIILFNVITGTIAALQAFDSAYVMTQGGPNNATLFYVYYIYQTAFGAGNLGYASALAWVLFIIVLIVTVVVFRTARHWVFYEGEVK